MAHHVLYGGAHLWSPAAPEKLAALSRASFEAHFGDAGTFAALCGGRPQDAEWLAARVRKKLETAPIESMCVDFEDGYGARSEEDEDRDAERIELSGPITGIRIKADRPRARRTLERFAGKLGARTVTLPKVESPDDVRWLVDTLDALGMTEAGVELMIETPRSLIDAEGRVAVGALVAAARGRCRAVHLGAYDLTASLGVSASDQRMDHPACDAARMLMLFALAGGTAAIYDGATTLLPVSKDSAAVRDAWTLHASNVRRALSMGIFAGWDLHPAQVPARWGTLFAYFAAERDAVFPRLRAFRERAEARRTGQVFDDAATVRGLVTFVTRGLACGAFDAAEVEGLVSPSVG